MKTQEKIIDPIEKKLLLKELTKENFLRPTNFGENKLYLIDKKDSPNIMKEIGRLREITFREEGGGTGKSCDIDEFDELFKQLIVWDPRAEEIIGGYREERMMNLQEGTKLWSPTASIFAYSPKFIDEYVPYAIELGRSFVQPKYQPKKTGGRQGMFSLDNLWDGLGALVVDNPDMNYFFGKVTMYPSYDSYVRNFILFFLKKHFMDKEGLMVPIHQVKNLENDLQNLDALSSYLAGVRNDEELVLGVMDVFKSAFEPILKKHTKEKVGQQLQIFAQMFGDNSYKEDIDLLIKMVRIFEAEVPPLVKQYIELSPKTITCGTSLSPDFWDVEETSFIVTIADIYKKKKDRHIESYVEYKNSLKK